MMQPTVLNDLDLWEAWIEFDHVNPDCFGILYIFGEVLTDKKKPSINLSRQVSAAEPNRLVLRIEGNAADNPVKATEVMYSEALNSVSDYDSIAIYSGDDLLIEFNEIEVLI